MATTDSLPTAPPESAKSGALLGLALAPFVTALAVMAAPRVTMSDGWGLASASAIAVAPAVISLRAASAASPRIAHAVLIGIPSLTILVAVFVRGLENQWILPFQNFALLGIAHALGGAIGRRIEHPGHALPAMIVAAAADVASVVHPSGPSHAIASSDRALGALALAVPVPGSSGFTFVLGVGDLVFIALLLGVAVRHGLSVSRVALLALVGCAVALFAAAVTQMPIPALVPIGALCVGGVPEFRRLSRRDRTTTLVAAMIAIAVVLGVLVRARTASP